jgi:ABC-type Fe3+ transport system substrate-binding protein
MLSLIKRNSFTIVCLLVLSVCAANAASEIPALKDAKNPAERARIQKLIDGARSEGKLIWEGGFLEPVHGEYVAKYFKEYYGLPNLVFQYTYTVSSRTVTQVEQLLKAGRPTPDIIWQGASHDWYRNLISRGKVVKYDSPSYAAYTLAQGAKLNNPGYWVSNGYCFTPMFNPVAMAKAGFPSFKMDSYWDLTNPKLKGMISFLNFTQSLTGALTAIGRKKVLGEKWFQDMTKLKPVSFVKTSQGREWVASGEYPISLDHHAKNAQVLRDGGTPVTLVYPKEGVVMVPYSSIILKDGSHQNAARLFVDYVFSERGANTIADSGAYLFFGRPGIKSRVPDLLPTWENIKVIPIDYEKEAREEDIRKIQQYCQDSGWCY